MEIEFGIDSTILDLKRSRLGGPEKISNTFRQLQTPLTEAVFDDDHENDLHFVVGGRTPEHKGDFQFEAPT